MQTFRVLSRIAVVLVVCVVLVGQASAQLPSASLSLTGGLAMPSGDFSSTTSAEAGGASTGWSAGAHVDLSIIPMFTVVGSFTYTSNGIQDEFVNALTGGQPYSGDIGSWTTMWPMVGLKYSLGVGPIATIYFTGQGGLVLGSSPDADITSGGTQVKVKSFSSSAFAFGVGAGVQLAGKFIVEVRFVSGKPEYDSETTFTDTGGTATFTGKYNQPTSIIQIHAGISL